MDNKIINLNEFRAAKENDIMINSFNSINDLRNECNLYYADFNDIVKNSAPRQHEEALKKPVRSIISTMGQMQDIYNTLIHNLLEEHEKELKEQLEETKEIIKTIEEIERG